MGQLPSFERVESALRQLGATEAVTEAHGSLCGLACVLGPHAGPAWLAGLTATPGQVAASAPRHGDVLDELAEVTCAALTAGEMNFTPLLPPDEEPLTLRATALASWCAGFMHGLGEAVCASGTRGVLERDRPREIMQDFAEIARVTLSDDETDLEAETAYAELVEFVRVAVQLVFEELGDVRQGEARASVH